MEAVAIKSRSMPSTMKIINKRPADIFTSKLLGIVVKGIRPVRVTVIFQVPDIFLNNIRHSSSHRYCAQAQDIEFLSVKEFNTRDLSE